MAVVDVDDAVGAGSLPTAVLPGVALRLRAPGVEAGALAGRLRGGAVPVFSTVGDGAVLLHLRTVLAGEEDLLLGAIGRVAAAAT